MDAFISNIPVFVAIVFGFLGFWLGWAAAYISGGANYLYQFERAEAFERENVVLLGRVQDQTRRIAELRKLVAEALPRVDSLSWEDQRHV